MSFFDPPERNPFRPERNPFRPAAPRRQFRWGLLVGVVILVIAGALASCGGNVPGASNGNDGRKTKYDNVRVQKIALTADEGGGFVLCVSDYHDGIAITCNWPQR